MDQQQTILNMVDEMGSIILTLQTDMIKVMNGINQLNMIISKIKQYKANNNMMNNMNNNMMNYMMNNMMKNMNIGMNNMIGFQDMNMQMPMNAMMNNMNMINQNPFFDDNEWSLIFENQYDGKIYNIKISKEKLFREAINMYRLKSGRTDKKFKFIFNNHEIYYEKKISETGLDNMSKILVISLENIKGG